MRKFLNRIRKDRPSSGLSPCLAATSTASTYTDVDVAADTSPDELATLVEYTRPQLLPSVSPNLQDDDKSQEDTQHSPDPPKPPPPAPLYLAFYARSKHPDSYHIALHLDNIAAPTSSIGVIKYHCKNVLKRTDSSPQRNTKSSPKDGEPVENPSSIASDNAQASNELTSKVIEIWTFERKELVAARDLWLLARVCLGYIPHELTRPRSTSNTVETTNTVVASADKESSPANESLVDELMRNVPVTELPTTDPHFNCVEWVRRALEALQKQEWLMRQCVGAYDTGKLAIRNREKAAARDSGIRGGRYKPVEWEWKDVLDGATTWVGALKKEGKAGVEVKGKLPDIGVGALCSVLGKVSKSTRRKLRAGRQGVTISA